MWPQINRGIAALAVVTALGAGGCGRGGADAKVGAQRSALSYQQSVPASADTRSYISAAGSWGINTSTGVDADTGFLSDRTDFDLLDGSGHLLYRGVLVTPDPSVNVDENSAEKYLAWGVGKNGVNLDPTSDEAQHVFLSFSNDAATTSP